MTIMRVEAHCIIKLSSLEFSEQSLFEDLVHGFLHPDRCEQVKVSSGFTTTMVVYYKTDGAVCVLLSRNVETILRGFVHVSGCPGCVLWVVSRMKPFRLKSDLSTQFWTH